MTEPGTQDGDDEQLWLERQICFPIYAASNLIQRLYRPLLAPLGLTYSQYLVMLVLWQRAPVSIGEIRGCLHLDIGTLSPLLKRMEGAGLVTRRRDPKDDRRVLIGLTDHGRAQKEAARDIPERLAARTGGDPEEMASLHRIHLDLVERLAAAAGAEA